MATLVLDSLTCVKKTGDAGSNDEVYINLSTEGLTGKLPRIGAFLIAQREKCQE